MTIGGKERAMALASILVMHDIPFHCGYLGSELYKFKLPKEYEDQVEDWISVTL